LKCDHISNNSDKYSVQELFTDESRLGEKCLKHKRFINLILKRESEFKVIKQETVDAITLEVFRQGLTSVAEQVASSIERSARSAVVREMLDYSAAVFDINGGIVAQSTRIPIHLNSMTRSLGFVLNQYPLQDWSEGDVYITNDPYSGGQHLPDIQTFSPVIWEGKCVAIVGACVHHLDVGGRGPGSYGADATELFQEGFRITPMKIIEKGKRNDIFFRLFQANIRVPDKGLGDLNSQIAALSIGSGEVQRILKRYGTSTFLLGTQELISSSERRMREAIKSLPEVPIYLEDVVDGDGLDDEPLTLKVKLQRKDDIIEIDFTGTSPQVRGPVNCPIAATESAVFYAVTTFLDPGLAPNHGSYKPIKVIAPYGSVLNPRFPAPVVGRMVFSHRIANAIMAALSQILPERAVAPYYGNSNVCILSTKDDEGKSNLLFEIEVGGWGGRQGLDGPDSLSAGIHNLANNPIEMVEGEFPILLLKYSLREDSGGLGEYRGGLGVERKYKILDFCELSLQFDRVKYQVPGVLGGLPGASAKVLVEHNGEVKELPGKVINYRLYPGDIVTVLTQGGGGLGEPNKRNIDSITNDIKSGKISRETYINAGILLEGDEQ